MAQPTQRGNIQVPAWVDSTNAVEFFTNMSSRLLAASGYPFDSANIPIYTNGIFVFSPDVHRILQVSLNLFDATTNHRGVASGPDFPTVLRPTFSRQPNGSDVDIYINGFTEVSSVTGASDPQFARPLDLSDPSDRAIAGAAPDQNIYGVPWLIGVKKGFPSFNEFAMQSVAQISRKLQIRKAVPGRFPITTNQMFVVGISNVFAFEAWNSYPSNYSRTTQIIIANDVTMTFGWTNDLAFDLRGGTVSIRPSLTAVTNISAGDWEGYGRSIDVPAHGSFVVPMLKTIVLLPDSIFRTASGVTVFTTNPAVGMNLVFGFEQTGRFVLPQFNYAISNRIRFLLIDAETGRVVDYLQLNELNGVRDLSQELATSTGTFVNGNSGSTPSEAIFWATNRPSGNSVFNPPLGVINQIQAALGIIDVPDWNSFGIGQAAGALKQKEIDAFRFFCGLPPKYNPGTVNTNLVTTVPFTPTRKISQYLTWQANDPFVHFVRQDLESRRSFNGIRREQPNGPILPVPNVGSLNDRFEPWGGSRQSSINSPGGVPRYSAACKDPLVFSAKDWDFENDGRLNFAWIGKVHRGTPWQTLYLKSAAVESDTWRTWLGGWDADSALRAEPVNDRPLLDALLRLLNTENPNRLLSINTSHTNGWRRVLNGLSVLTNSSSDAELDSFPPVVRFETDTMRAGDTQAAAIAAAILQTRDGKIWQDVSDVLATPELAENSPWLNLSSDTQLQQGISDEAYEKIASQLLPRLRMDSKGSARLSANGRALEFTGYDGCAYAIEASSDLIHWNRVAKCIPTNGVIRFTDPSPTQLGNQFYRSRLLP